MQWKAGSLLTQLHPLNNTGPNAVLYTLEPYVDELLSVLLYFYPGISGTQYV
jgi:hypothetical protein